MSFLSPLLLAGLLALAIPVVIHLIQRERKQVVAFPSLMFVRRIPYQSVRRRQIRNWLLLLMRAAAVALIVAAFARPFFRHPALAVGPIGGTREVAILLDRSYSMGYGDRWQRAKSAARQAVGQLGSGDRATLILFSRGADLPVRSTTDRQRLISLVDAARVGDEVTRYGPALKLAQSVLVASAFPRREVIVISDFQKVGWQGAQDLRFPEGTVLNPVVISDAKTSNVTVSGVTLQRARFSGHERVTVGAGLVNRSERQVNNLPVALEIDGRVVQTVPVTIASNATASVSFAPVTLAEAYTRGTVRISNDGLPQDNAFRFVLSPGKAVSVLLIGRADAPRDAGLYLTRAMAVGTAPVFDLETVTPERAANAELGKRSVVILNDAASARGIGRDRLRAFVENGGGLLVVAGERSEAAALDPELVPGALGAVIDRSATTGGTFGVLDYSHPVFELFKAPRSGDVSAARFFRYRSFEPATAARVLARFDDGAVALAERRIGRGRVMVWTSTLDSAWNDLVLKPVFVPFLHRVVQHLAGYTEPTAWLTVGQVVDQQTRGRVVLTPSGQRISLEQPSGSATSVWELTEAGFYEVHNRTGRESRPLTVAANVDVAESDLAPLDPQELVGAVAGRASGARPSTALVEEAGPQEQERRQALWWYLLLVGMLLLASETIVSNRLARISR